MANAYQVALGIYDNCIPGDPKRTVHEVEAVKIHGLYAKEDPWFDIAIVTLKEDVDYVPICLPEKSITSLLVLFLLSYIFKLTNWIDTHLPPYGVVTGFGVTQEGASSEPCLQQEVAVEVHDRVS